jgi:hypothetical protein
MVDELHEVRLKNSTREKKLNIVRGMIKVLCEDELNSVKAIERDAEYELRFWS